MEYVSKVLAQAWLVTFAIVVIGGGAGFAVWRGIKLYEKVAEVRLENRTLQERLADMTRNADQFHDELEACQREKGVEWRERMEAVCAGYAMGGTQ
jgi:hypothetical protein